MRTIAFGLMLMGANPAAAQIWDGGRSAVPEVQPIETGVRPMLRHVRRDIRLARAQGQISRTEARTLRREAARIAAAESRYRTAGLSGSERAELVSRTHALDSLVSARRAP